MGGRNGTCGRLCGRAGRPQRIPARPQPSHNAPGPPLALWPAALAGIHRFDRTYDYGREELSDGSRYNVCTRASWGPADSRRKRTSVPGSTDVRSARHPQPEGLEVTGRFAGCLVPILSPARPQSRTTELHPDCLVSAAW